MLTARWWCHGGVCLQDLLERYNPTHGMTVQERTRATARRVGLDVPKEGKPMGENET